MAEDLLVASGNGWLFASPQSLDATTLEIVGDVW